MDEPKPDEPDGYAPGKCKCKPWEIDVPNPNEPFRRLLLALEKALQDLSTEPSEATKKFADDLKDAEKENQGIAAIVTKYKEFYEKLDCKLADAKRWKAEIDDWSKGLGSEAKQAIEWFWITNYADKETKICCDWIRLRYKLHALLDCLEQAKKTEEEAQQDYDAIKGIQDTLTKVFAELESLYKKAKAFNAEQRPKSVYAVSLEFAKVYRTLWPRDWSDVKKGCPKPTDYEGDGETYKPQPPEGEYAQQPPPTPPEGGRYGDRPEMPPDEPAAYGEYGQQGYPAPGGPSEDIKADLNPDKLRNKLTVYLRALILAKYQRFRWHHEILTTTSKTADGKKACEKFRAERQEQFIEEADDIVTPPPGPGNGGGAGSEQPTSGYPEKTPTSGYQDKPPTGGYPDKPPTGGYPEKPPTGGYEEGAPTDTYPEKPSTPGGYPEKPPKGGYQDTSRQPGRQKS